MPRPLGEVAATLHIEEKRNDTKSIFPVLMDVYDFTSKQHLLTAMKTKNRFQTVPDQKTENII